MFASEENVCFFYATRKLNCLNANTVKKRHFKVEIGETGA